MTQQSDTVMVEDLDAFVAVLADWHTSKVAGLKHMQSIPAGAEVTFNEGSSNILTGDLLKGFQLGIELSLLELGTLPFYTEDVSIPSATEEHTSA